MGSAGALRAKQPRNAWLTGAAAAVMLLLYAGARAIAPWSPKRGAGLVFGVAATLVFVFLW